MKANLRTFCAVSFLIGVSAASILPRTCEHSGSPQNATLAPVSALNCIRTSASALNPFGSITPSTCLNWTPCGSQLGYNASTPLGTVECARFLVPFDHDETTNKSAEDRQFKLAVARLPATDKENYRGPLFVHFGGPSSGVDELLVLGPEIQRVVGGSYDIVAWDQRGVGSTLPVVSCYRDCKAFERAQADLAASRNNITQSEYTNGFLWSMQVLDQQGQDLGARCEKYGRGRLPYVGTVATARDLAMLVDAYGYSRKLSFWGFSYGSVLGAAFSSIFPGRVERVILDGVLQHSRYYSREPYPELYTDLDAELNDFFNLCFLAGQSRCPLWFPTVAEIKTAFYDVGQRFGISPLPSTRGGFVTMVDWVNFVSGSLYSPLASWKTLAAVVHQVYREGVVNATLLNASPPRIELVLEDPETGLTNNDAEILFQIVCGDKENSTIKGLEEILPTYERLANESEWGEGIALSVAPQQLFCGRYPARTTDRLEEFKLERETKHPILFIGNTRDVATPLQAAINMTAFFKDSVVLTNNVSGHTSAAELFNPCIGLSVKQYFFNGTLPREGTVCQPAILPFGLLPNGTLIDEAVLVNTSIPAKM